jgi:hypothetical protein
MHLNTIPFVVSGTAVVSFGKGPDEGAILGYDLLEIGNHKAGHTTGFEDAILLAEKSPGILILKVTKDMGGVTSGDGFIVIGQRSREVVENNPFEGRYEIDIFPIGVKAATGAEVELEGGFGGHSRKRGLYSIISMLKG